MLVLSRNYGEKIIIEVNGQVITIAVVDIQNDKVKIGVEADKSIRIDREEIYYKKKLSE